MKLKQLIISICLALIFAVMPHRAVKTDLKFYLSNSKGLDYQFAGKQDAHRFGVELKENKQFHHTITAEDGVRLGCYGFELEGKKYSTNYIADGKGYRLAPTDTDLITVFSKGSTEPRIASFVESFNEEELKAANIRYLFPDGCQAPTILYDPNNPSTRYENRKKLFDSLIEKAQKARNEEKDKFDRSIASRALKTQELDDRNKNGNKNNNNSNNNNTINNLNNVNSRNNNNGYNYDANKNPRGSDFDCCNNDRIQIILPTNDSCSQNTAKLIIPISSEKLSSIPITEFINLHSSSSITFVLKELQYLVQKYNL
ncbi:uncharacterized protein DDB_G0275275-like [Chironomus tepperi]|uniref:uncharacterized protein DDB_G0275275-like n=1 Tax=Chironomus tepperi TaxID=113505 RepID=UPI00391F818C